MKGSNVEGMNVDTKKSAADAPFEEFCGPTVGETAGKPSKPVKPNTGEAFTASKVDFPSKFQVNIGQNWGDAGQYKKVFESNCEILQQQMKANGTTTGVIHLHLCKDGDVEIKLVESLQKIDNEQIRKDDGDAREAFLKLKDELLCDGSAIFIQEESPKAITTVAITIADKTLTKVIDFAKGDVDVMGREPTSQTPSARNGLAAVKPKWEPPGFFGAKGKGVEVKRESSEASLIYHAAGKSNLDTEIIAIRVAAALMTSARLNKGVQYLFRNAAAVVTQPPMKVYVVLGNQGRVNLGKVCRTIDEQVGRVLRSEKLVPVDNAGVSGSRVLTVTIRPHTAELQAQLVKGKVNLVYITDVQKVGAFCKIATIGIMSAEVFITQKENVSRPAQEDEVSLRQPAVETPMEPANPTQQNTQEDSVMSDSTAEVAMSTAAPSSNIGPLHLEKLDSGLVVQDTVDIVKSDGGSTGGNSSPRGTKRSAEDVEAEQAISQTIDSGLAYDVETDESEGWSMVGGANSPLNRGTKRSVDVDTEQTISQTSKFRVGTSTIRKQANSLKPSHSYASLAVEGPNDDEDATPMETRSSPAFAGEGDALVVPGGEVETLSPLATTAREVS
jgi:hypothetical protein